MRRSSLTLLAGGILICCLIGEAACVRSETGSEPADLLQGAGVLYSLDAGETFSAEPPTISPRTRATVMVRLSFVVPEAVADPSGTGRYASLTLSHDVVAPVRAMRFVLNDRELAPPLEDMLYRAVPGIDPRWLTTGENSLVVEMEVRNGSQESDMVFAPEISLTALRSSDLSFQTGPLLGAFDEESFTVTCRTNMPATVSVYRTEAARRLDGLEGMERVAGTGLGLLHRVRVPRQDSGEAGAYAVVAERDGYWAGRTIEPPSLQGGGLRFVVVGDTRTNVADWQAVAEAVAESRPDLVVHVGDMVTNGRRDWEWDTEFWEPGRALLENVPVYAVIGNHERNAPFYDEIFFTPSEDGRARNWLQELGSVLLIGIDGEQDWSNESDNAHWLEETLSQSKARFVFLFTHYPGFSSSGHGRLDEEGHPVERPARDAREIIIPILSKRGATAFVAGHDHVYERSELPDGLTAITCGGGGAGLYRRTEDADLQNPYSQVFFDLHHFCLFEASSDRVTLQAVTPAGELLDAREWRAR
ncbi:MAG: metallophosphoesterase [Gemmatimonadota bacterium]|nr:MAG: metallophosphoesterase [Gemmatimonadota bacterium]